MEAGVGDLFGAKRALIIARALQECRAAHQAGELGYFQQRLKSSDMWRLLPGFLASGFADDIAYLDIETRHEKG